MNNFSAISWQEQVRFWWGPLCTRSTCLLVLLVLPHWNHSVRVNMSLHSDTLSSFLPGMIPLYDLEPLWQPQNNVHQRCRFYTTHKFIHQSQVFIAYGVSRTTLNSVFRFIKMSETWNLFIRSVRTVSSHSELLLLLPKRNESNLLALKLIYITEHRNKFTSLIITAF